MKTVFFLIALIGFNQLNFGQVNSSVAAGIVQNKNGEKLQAATIVLYSQDSTEPPKKLPGAAVVKSKLVMTTVSDTAGRFAFKIAEAGWYFVSVTMAGFKEYKTIPFLADSINPSKDLGKLVLVVADPANLQQVIVTGKKPLMEQQVDRMVINVEAMIGAPGNNALEILEKTPGVTVDMAGSIGLNGKNGVMVLIDGRPTQMSSNDLSAYLKSIPGGSLDKIELIDNPPARYEAAGNAIINIRLKKNRLQGFNGNLSTGISQGIYTQSNNSVIGNFNRKKINISSSLGYSYNSGYSLNTGTRSFFDQDQQVVSSLQNRGSAKFFGNSVNARLAVDYAATDNTSLGFIYSTNQRSGQDKQLNQNSQFNQDAQLDSTSFGETGVRNNWSGNSFNLNFLHRYKKPGRELSADANYMAYRNRGNQQLFNQVMDEDGKPAFQERFAYRLPSDMNIYTVQADYMHPLSKKIRLDAGVKTSHVMNDNEFKVADNIPGSGIPVNDRSNRFIYRETISAVYVSGRKEWKRFSMQAGLRLENTRTDGNQLGNANVTGSRFKKEYTNAFPSFFASYKMDTSNINFLDLSYSRRVRRPNYQSLNPFVYFVDQYSLSSGNPDLNPQFAYQLEFKYRYRKYFGIGLQYNYHNDVIFQVTEASDKVFINRPRNVAKGQITSLITNATIPVAKWWNINVNINLAHLHLQGEAYEQLIDQETFSVRANLNQQFMLGGGFNAEIAAVYNGRDINGQRYVDPRYRVNAGVLKKVLKGKGTIRLSVDDIFYSWRQQDESRSLQNAIAYNLYISDTRRGAIGFTWAFGKESSGKKRTLNENSAQEEKGRVD